MSNKLKQLKSQEGFTIIEVVIVLVIGAVIMLAVFLIVPQLQRTQRNSRRQNDARRLLSAVEQFRSNNNGTNPTTADTTALTDILGTFKDPNGSNYTITFANGTPTSAANMNVGYDQKCANNIFSSATGQTAVVVWTEGTPTTYCIGG